MPLKYPNYVRWINNQGLLVIYPHIVWLICIVNSMVSSAIWEKHAGVNFSKESKTIKLLLFSAIEMAVSYICQ